MHQVSAHAHTVDARHEACENLVAMWQVHDLRVELDTVEGFRVMRDCSRRRVLCASYGAELRGQRRVLVAVRHPHLWEGEHIALGLHETGGHGSHLTHRRSRWVCSSPGSYASKETCESSAPRTAESSTAMVPPYAWYDCGAGGSEVVVRWAMYIFLF